MQSFTSVARLKKISHGRPSPLTHLSPVLNARLDSTIFFHVLALRSPCIKAKVNLNSYPYTLRGTPKGFMKTFKNFIKLFEAP